MLGTFVYAATLLVLLFINTENGVNAAPEPCKDILSYYMGFKKPEKTIQMKDNENMEKDKKKNLLHKLEKMFEKILRRALHLEVKETTVRPRGPVEDLLTSYINFLTRLWNI